MLNEFIGKVANKIEVAEDKREIIFSFDDGSEYKMYHDQDCCESVMIEEIIGNLDDLLNTQMLMAEEESNEVDIELQIDDLCIWTFYKFATVKGYVTIRWYGSSNGYYAVDVSIEKTK